MDRGFLPPPEQLDAFMKGCRLLGLSPSLEMLAIFEAYHDHLLSWNARINLISRNDQGWIYIQHFLDSLSALPFLDLSGHPTVLDLGAGAGFPGLPIYIVHPDLRLDLLESKQKKVAFLSSLIRRLGFSEVSVFCDRAEHLACEPLYQARYRLILARAVADLPSLVEWSWPLLQAGGSLVAYKGPDFQEEVAHLQRTPLHLRIAALEVSPVHPGINRLTGKDRYIVTVRRA